MTLETCRFCGLRLVKPCQTEDQADDCERKPCPEPDDYSCAPGLAASIRRAEALGRVPIVIRLNSK